MYKKKSLKFIYEECSRVTRHAETLKARESSRFKRLSMIRSIDDSDLLYAEKSMETVEKSEKSVEYKEQKVKKQPLSRLEMLFKWKEEKQMKKELEMKAKKKPFYVGGSTQAKNLSDNKNLQTMKSSFIAQPNTSFITSKASKSRLLTSGTTTQPSRIPNNSKQLTSSSTFQSRIPNSRQANSVTKSVSIVKKGHDAPTFPKKPTKPVHNPAISSINQAGSVPKALNINSKAPLEKHIPNSMKVGKTNNSVKPVIQGSLQTKSLSKIPSKPLQKARTVIPKPATRITSISKAIPVQGKMPVKSMNQKSTVTSKVHQKETSHSMENVKTRKGYCFKKTVTDSLTQQAENLNKVPSEDAMKKTGGKTNIEIKHTEIESLSEKSLENVPDITFNSDISIIKPASFAPAGFRFQPPTGLPDFTFHDDDDPYEALEQVKLKFMSRTSTPTKPAERNSSPKNCKSPCIDSSLMDKNKSSQESFNKSTSENISDLISLNSSLKDKIFVDKETNDESVSQDDYEEAAETEAVATETEAINRGCDVLLKSSLNEKDLFCNFAENGDVKENSVKVSLKIDSYESQCNVSPMNEAPQNISEENISFDDSVLDTIDLNKIKDIFEEQNELIKSEDEEINKVDILEEPEILKCTGKKLTGAMPKRVSILKSMSNLNAIAETSEIDEYVAQTPDKSSQAKQDFITPRRSKRISTRQHLDILSVCENKTNVNSPLSSSVTPRRSLRLKKISGSKLEFGSSVLSPFEEKSNSKIIPRCSMRLIDLNTPEKGGNEQRLKTNLTCDFEKLSLKDSENVDPSMLVMDFESPDIISKFKSKKVSLLYTPEKRRKSVRKSSIKGDLIAFSPAN